MSFENLEPVIVPEVDGQLDVAVYIIPPATEIPLEMKNDPRVTVVDPKSSLYERLAPLCADGDLKFRQIITTLSGAELQTLTNAWGALVQHKPHFCIFALLDVPAGTYSYNFLSALPGISVREVRYPILIAEMEASRVQAQSLRDQAPWKSVNRPRFTSRQSGSRDTEQQDVTPIDASDRSAVRIDLPKPLADDGGINDDHN